MQPNIDLFGNMFLVLFILNMESNNLTLASLRHNPADSCNSEMWLEVVIFPTSMTSQLSNLI